jgi:hypothetical protein
MSTEYQLIPNEQLSVDQRKRRDIIDHLPITDKRRKIYHLINDHDLLLVGSKGANWNSAAVDEMNMSFFKTIMFKHCIWAFLAPHLYFFFIGLPIIGVIFAVANFGICSLAYDYDYIRIFGLKLDSGLFQLIAGLALGYGASYAAKPVRYFAEVIKEDGQGLPDTMRSYTWFETVKYAWTKGKRRVKLYVGIALVIFQLWWIYTNI